MFLIRDNQMAVFKDVAFHRYENEVVGHIRTFFPLSFADMEEEGVRKTIRYGYRKALGHGFSTRRNVCLYLNCMLQLGSDFDNDPLFPWTRQLLKDPALKTADDRIDRLSDRAAVVGAQFGELWGAPFAEALRRLSKPFEGIFQAPAGTGFPGVVPYLENVFPEKYEAIGDGPVQAMVRLSEERAAAYVMTGKPEQLVYAACMFLWGSGFDKDPQFPWAAQALGEPARERARALYYATVDHAARALSPVHAKSLAHGRL